MLSSILRRRPSSRRPVTTCCRPLPSSTSSSPQHFGQERLSPPEHRRTYALLYPLLDLTTTLDPYFSIAYRFGAIYMGEAYPGGPGRPDLAVALLKKGLAAQPDKWQYMMDL